MPKQRAAYFRKHRSVPFASDVVHEKGARTSISPPRGTTGSSLCPKQCGDPEWEAEILAGVNGRP
ncbi:MAG: hypothetical protein ABR583_01175 [Gaiellaceae bacterium]